MIRLLDNNALIFLERSKSQVLENSKCLVLEEIKDEFLDDGKSDSWFRGCEFVDHPMGAVEFLSEYTRALNEYPGVSFYSLKGFGDVAIVAALRLLVLEFSQRSQTLSEKFFPPEPIHLVSVDAELRKFVLLEFGTRITIETPMEFAQTL